MGIDGSGKTEALKCAFVVEQFLGHRTHYRNLQRNLNGLAGFAPTWVPIEYDATDLVSRLPPFSRYIALQASIKARQKLRAVRPPVAWDAIYYHTQTAALLSPFHGSAPTVISMDATPIGYDTIGQYYGHRSGGAGEGLKLKIYRAVFNRAAALVTWSRWAKDSLVRDYGMPAEKITVIAPGVDLKIWPSVDGQQRLAASSRRLPKLLFVGGDFKRKGGEELLQAFRERLSRRCELHVVTEAKLEPGENLFVYNGMTPYCEALLTLYAEADVFVLPTLADCYAQVIPEAMAAGLPVITTRVAATAEAIDEGKTGLVVTPGDAAGLAKAVEALLDRPELRAAMGDAARRSVEQYGNVMTNALRIVELLKRVARQPASKVA
jgi:glycosyltransferase involved in cell wall biosynthesis